MRELCEELTGGQLLDAGGQIVVNANAQRSPQEHVSNGTKLENIVEKLLQAGEGSQEHMVEYTRREC